VKLSHSVQKVKLSRGVEKVKLSRNVKMCCGAAKPNQDSSVYPSSLYMLILIIKELKFSVEHDRVVTTLNTIKH
jgi:hypothetical protein